MSEHDFNLEWLTQWHDPEMGSHRFKRYRARPGDLFRVDDGRLLGSKYADGMPHFMVQHARPIDRRADRVLRKMPISIRRLAAQHGWGPNQWHAVVLDVDLPARLLPSSTEGHYHLFIDCPMPWYRYRRLLKALAKAGVIEPGYYRASRRYRMSMVRKPGVLKDDPADALGIELDEQVFDA